MLAGALAVPGTGYVKGSISQYFDHRACQLNTLAVQGGKYIKGGLQQGHWLRQIANILKGLS